jgi:hypothetical protein
MRFWGLIMLAPVLMFAQELSVNDITHQQRIDYGLYTVLQIPHLLTLHQRLRGVERFDDSLDRANQVRWILSKNDFNPDAYRVLILNMVYMPEECMNREGNRYTQQSLRCVELRYYVADSFIMATQLQQMVAEYTGQEDDWRSLEKLAEVTASIVIGVDGPPIILKIEGDAIIQVENDEIQIKYRHRTWWSVVDRAREELSDE